MIKDLLLKNCEKNAEKYQKYKRHKMTQLIHNSLQYELIFLKDSIVNGNYPKSSELFLGADVTILTPNSKWINVKTHHFDNDLRVVTPFAYELSALLFKLRDIAYKCDLIDFSNKYMFFGELAESANNYIKINDDGIGKLEELLMVVFYKAEKIINNLRIYHDI
mgnify:CR=1 FL=1